MRYLALLIAIVFLASCGGESSSSGATLEAVVLNTDDSPSAPLVIVAPDDFEARLNAVRAANGAGAVTTDARLQLAAQTHADNMLRQDFFSHTGADGSSLRDRVGAVGYGFSAIAENIAKGQTSAAEVMASWTGSSGHHRNNINPVYTQYGLATAGTGRDKVWVLVLGTPR